MAEESQSPSPPLPPDPSAQKRSITPNAQQPRESAAGPQITPPLPMQEPQPDLTRHDSLRSQATTKLPPVQPIQAALDNALEHSPASAQLDPDFIKRVAEEVAKNLATTSITPTTTQAPQQSQFARTQPSQQVPRSPTQDSTGSIPRRYTPPTPERNADGRGQDVSGQTSPVRAPSEAGSSFSRASRESFKSSESHRSRETPKPVSPSAGRSSSAATAFRREESGARMPNRRDSRDSEASYDGASTKRARPARVPSDVDETTALEKAWGPLFDNGNPTPRLSQFLRGLAIHLIKDYEPKMGLVITPPKMLRFFKESAVDNEHYPWDLIFGGQLSGESISSMYRKLLCRHALVQGRERNDVVPNIPGLTREGFDSFMTCLIQAHPDTEFDRLAKAAMNMPISNPDKKWDEKPERFPKELSRRLFPAEGNIQAEQRLVASLNHEQSLAPHIKSAVAMPPPPPSAPPPQPSAYPERERKPYSQRQASNAVDDEDLSAPPIPIERERKPYTAREGTGRMYEGEEGRPSTQQYKPELPRSSATSRNNSGLPPQAMFNSSNGQSDPMAIPPRSHRMSVGGPPPAMLNGVYPRPGKRGGSPPPRNPYVRSDPFDVGSMPTSQYGSNLYPSQSNPFPNVDMEEEDRTRRYQSRSRADRANTTNTNVNDDDPNARRGYPIPGRGVPIGNGYEYGGAPPTGTTPVGSYPVRRPTMPPNASSDDRRRSMYGSPNPGFGGFGSADGGTDGYGSFAAQMNGYPSQPYGSSAQH